MGWWDDGRCLLQKLYSRQVQKYVGISSGQTIIGSQHKATPCEIFFVMDDDQLFHWKSAPAPHEEKKSHFKIKKKITMDEWLKNFESINRVNARFGI